MIYLVYQDNNGWRISRSDGRLDEITRSYKKLDVRGMMIYMSAADVDYQVYKLFKRVPQELRYLN